MKSKINKEHIHRVLKQYSITLHSLDKIIDTSHGEDDIRLNIILNNMYVLKMNSTEMISESFLQGINTLIEKYNSIGVWCPTIFKNKEGNLLTIIELNSQRFHCYLEEKAPFSFCEEKDMYAFKKKMLPHVGKLAHLYSNQDLVSSYSMFSILDLGSMCLEIDEKQENLNDLIKALSNKGFKQLADVLQEKNTVVRSLLQKKYQNLPRCVYQGDLNPSNILVDQYKNFVGIIDFNMYGTDVNINYFINESMYYMQKEDFDFSTEDIIEKSESIMKELLECILQEYTLNDLEKEMLPYYKFITMISFYPNVQLWISLLEENVHVSKVIELLNTYIINVAV